MSFRVQRDRYFDVTKSIELTVNSTTTNDLNLQQILVASATAGSAPVPDGAAGYVTVSLNGLPYLVPVYNVSP